MPKLRVQSRPKPKPKGYAEYFDLFCWRNGKKIKIGYAAHDAEKNMVKLKADDHLDPQKMGRLLINGKIQIESRKVAPKPIENNYKSAADEYDVPVRQG